MSTASIDHCLGIQNKLINDIVNLPLNLYYEGEDLLMLTEKRQQIIYGLFRSRTNRLIVQKAREIGITSFMAAVAAFVLLKGWKFNYFCKSAAMAKEFGSKVIELMVRLGDSRFTKSQIQKLWKEGLTCFTRFDQTNGISFDSITINFVDEAAFIDYALMFHLVGILPYDQTLIASTPTNNNTIFYRMCTTTRRQETGWLFWKKVKYVPINEVIHLTWEDCPWLWKDNLTFRKDGAELLSTGKEFPMEEFDSLKKLGWKPSCKMVDNYMSASLSIVSETNEMKGEFCPD